MRNLNLTKTLAVCAAILSTNFALANDVAVPSGCQKGYEKEIRTVFGEQRTRSDFEVAGGVWKYSKGDYDFNSYANPVKKITALTKEVLTGQRANRLLPSKDSVYLYIALTKTPMVVALPMSGCYIMTMEVNDPQRKISSTEREYTETIYRELIEVADDSKGVFGDPEASSADAWANKDSGAWAGLRAIKAAGGPQAEAFHMSRWFNGKMPAKDMPAAALRYSLTAWVYMGKAEREQLQKAYPELTQGIEAALATLGIKDKRQVVDTEAFEG